MRLELTSIFFTANVSRCRVPHLWFERYPFLLLLEFLCRVVLRVQEVPKTCNHQTKQHEVEYPRCCLDEFVSSLEKNPFNAGHVFRSYEMVHCSLVRRETPVFSEPKHLGRKGILESDQDGQESGAECHGFRDDFYRESTRRVLYRHTEAGPSYAEEVRLCVYGFLRNASRMLGSLRWMLTSSWRGTTYLTDP